MYALFWYENFCVNFILHVLILYKLRNQMNAIFFKNRKWWSSSRLTFYLIIINFLLWSTISVWWAGLCFEGYHWNKRILGKASEEINSCWRALTSINCLNLKVELELEAVVSTYQSFAFWKASHSVVFNVDIQTFFFI